MLVVRIEEEIIFAILNAIALKALSSSIKIKNVFKSQIIALNQGKHFWELPGRILFIF